MPYVVDVSGRGEPIGTLVRRGAVALVLLVVLVVVLLMQYRGMFRSTFPVSAVIPDVGDGVNVGADVKLRGVVIGEVAGVRPRTSPGGPLLHEIDLRLDPEKAAGVPAGVTARVVPTNAFGAPSVELLDPAVITSRMLARNAVITADTSEQTIQLQTVLNQVYRVLNAVRPADLNVALTNISQALQGRGSELGSLIGNGDQYFTALNGQTQNFNALLAQLGPTVQSLDDNAPDLLDSVDNLVATGQTFLAKRNRLVEVLTQAPDVADHGNDLLHQIDDPALRLLSDLHPVGDLLAGQYQNIPASLGSLRTGVNLLSTGIRGGLSLSINLTPFPAYTYADCPRYHELKGPNCGRAVPPGSQLPPGFPFFEQHPGQVLPTPPNLLPSPPGGQQAGAIPFPNPLLPAQPKDKADSDDRDDTGPQSPRGWFDDLFGDAGPSGSPVAAPNRDQAVRHG